LQRVDNWLILNKEIMCFRKDSLLQDILYIDIEASNIY
jgi:hypothetical protein